MERKREEGLTEQEGLEKGLDGGALDDGPRESRAGEVAKGDSGVLEAVTLDADGDARSEDRAWGETNAKKEISALSWMRGRQEEKKTTHRGR